jgi:hypothetical protein
METVRADCKEFKMYMKGKEIRKKRHLTALLLLFSGRSFQQLNFENDIGRNFLAGK